MKKLELSINKYQSVEDEEFQYILLKAIERDAEEIVESATKINKIILEDYDIIPENYRDSFLSLSRIKLLDKKFCERLANTVGFRNRLAHEYMNPDSGLTVKSAKTILRSYPKYLNKILKSLEQK